MNKIILIVGAFIGALASAGYAVVSLILAWHIVEFLRGVL